MAKTTPSAPVAKPAKHNKRWVAEDEQQLITEYALGVSLDIIAERLDRTVISILHRLSTHGLVEFDKEENAYYTVPALLYQFS